MGKWTRHQIDLFCMWKPNFGRISKSKSRTDNEPVSPTVTPKPWSTYLFRLTGVPYKVANLRTEQVQKENSKVGRWGGKWGGEMRTMSGHKRNCIAGWLGTPRDGFNFTSSKRFNNSPSPQIFNNSTFTFSIENIPNPPFLLDIKGFLRSAKLQFHRFGNSASTANIITIWCQGFRWTNVFKTVVITWHFLRGLPNWPITALPPGLHVLLNPYEETCSVLVCWTSLHINHMS